MPHKAHAELPFLQCAMIKLLQKFLSTPKPTSSHLELTRDCVGVHKMFAGASLNAFPTLLLSFSVFILCQTSVLTTVSQFTPLTIWEASLFSLHQHTLKTLVVEIMGVTGAFFSSATKKHLLSPGSRGFCWIGELPLASSPRQGGRTVAWCRQQWRRSCAASC